GKKLCQILNLPEPAIWDNQVLFKLANEVTLFKDFNYDVLSKLLYTINELDVEQPKIPKLIGEFRSYLTTSAEIKDIILEKNLEEIRLSIEELDEFNNTWTTFKSKGMGESLVAFRNALALGQLNSNNSDKGLMLSTVHTMKGLEKEIVFLIGMCEGVFPDYRAITEKQIDEERNNAFVAITRAKRWLYISYPKQRIMPWGDTRFQKKSRFMIEMES
ncbi:3'-5' exonuclease, partial [Acinetobacter pittii]|uniref:3'-5' exonuclease n=1 Tax=Acinetobacter pittii TaxID=48296 RepID=UPI003B42E865